MARAYFGLGANLGDRAAALRSAVDALRQHGTLVAVSSLYETAPVGYTNQPAFLNAVIALDTDESPEALLAAAFEAERARGRVRTFRNAPRTLDVDLLLYDDLCRDDPDLTIPHPRLHERAFVLVPLSEIAPDISHPRLGRSVRDLLAALGDTSADVRLVAGPEWVTE